MALNTRRRGSKADKTSPVSVWREQERIDDKLVDAGVIILRTTGCSHFHEGGCTMCGYNAESMNGISSDDLRKQLDEALGRLGEIGFLKVYTSGSFLDEREIPSDVADEILRRCSNLGVRLLFESRPEYIDSIRLEHLAGLHDDLEIALGLESSNEKILRYSINKGFTVADYEVAADMINDAGIDVRTYVLLKPPFLTESEAVSDAVSTAKFAAPHCRTISINPVNVQKGTIVEKLWRQWAYRPPWLWSVLEVLRACAGLDRRVVCDPSGGGKGRGAHNCGQCDDSVLASIRKYSLGQDPSKLATQECECMDLWKAITETESFVIGGTVDLERFFRKHRA
ncbi:MAG TPA: archaeosine biosynthesis radical SAM protein RaSEA [Thermoplasmata archaeon]|nr:archaeosine biosynthesis radical SAM protein RaSEA [Thermoplasmata archaeon]